MLTLSKNEFIKQVGSIEVSKTVQVVVPMDITISPLQAYTALKCNDSSGYSYLLESVEKEKRHSRFSFVGTNPAGVVTIKNRRVTIDFFTDTPLIEAIRTRMRLVCREIVYSDKHLSGSIATGFDVFDALRAVVAITTPENISGIGFDRQVFSGGAIGFVAYDSVYDSHLDIEPLASITPDAQFVLVTRTLIFDHLTEKTHLYFTEHITKESDTGKVYDRICLEAGKIEKILQEPQSSPRETKPPECIVSILGCTAEEKPFEQMVLRAKQHIVDGDILQVVVSRRYELETSKRAFDLYQKLRSVNPSPYMYLFEFNDTAIIGASPETLLSVLNRKVTTNPIAGTCPRGTTPEEDEAFAEEMLSSEKEQAEHVMLVDLGRNDVRAVCKSGSVVVEDYMSVLKYSHVQHIESTVVGELREECDAFDATREIFPAGTLSGAPKIRAMEIIHDLEGVSRGIYGGGVGYYCFNGDADFAIVIRTMIKTGNRVYVQAGAGIVADSDPEYEYNETERKMAALMKGVFGEEIQ